MADKFTQEFEHCRGGEFAINPLELARMRLVKAFISHRQAKTNGLSYIAIDIKGKRVLLDNLSVVSLCEVLINEFEMLTYQEYGRKEGLTMITESYRDYVKRSGSITSNGYDLIIMVLKAAALKVMTATSKQEKSVFMAWRSSNEYRLIPSPIMGNPESHAPAYEMASKRRSCQPFAQAWVLKNQSIPKVETAFQGRRQ